MRIDSRRDLAARQCLACGTPTDSALGIIGEHEWVLATIQLLLPTEEVRERFAAMFRQAGRSASDLESMFVWVCRECVRSTEAGFPDPTAMMVSGSVHMVIQSGFELDRLTPGDAALASIFRAREVMA